MISSALSASALKDWERIAAGSEEALLELIFRLLGPRPPPWQLRDEHGARLFGAEELRWPKRRIELPFADRQRGTLVLSERTPLHSADETVVANLGLALALYRAGDELASQRDRFRLIAQVSALVATEPDLNRLLSRAADLIHQRLGYPNVDIPLYDAERKELVIRIRGGHYKEQIHGEDRLPIDQGIMGSAVRERRTQRVNDVANDPRYQCPPGVVAAGAELAVPILHGAELLGVLNVEGERPFDDLDVLSLETVAEHLAGAIVTARLHGQARQAAVQEERQRLGRELQDNLTQMLSSAYALAQNLPAVWQRDRAEGERRAGRLHQLTGQAMSELKALLRELSPGTEGSPVRGEHSNLMQRFALREQGLAAAIERHAVLAAPETLKLKIDFAAYRALPIALEEGLLEIAQEAINNAVKHAQARTLSVRAMVESGLVELIVSDDGCGMGMRAHKGAGLRQMHERAQAISARLQVQDARPHGTRIVVRARAAESAPADPA
ncbi:MAG: GAF domain-containing protein [Xanthomonadales bacterium]|nr:GAF domain-containing protein [Xanthomonadales bacterium]